MAEKSGIGHRRAVVRERHGARGGKLHEIAELGTAATSGDRRDGQHARTRGRRRARDDLSHKSGGVDRRLGVWHRANRREAAAQRRPSAGRDRLRFLETRLAQMRVQVDEARDHEEASCFEGPPVEAHARSSSNAADPAARR